MSSVPKSKRKKHDFETPHKLHKLRLAVTELAINDFGYDRQKMEEKIRRFETGLTNFERKAEVAARMRQKNESYYADFVKEETVVTRDMARMIICEFEMGNNIFPSGEARVAEFRKRREHLDECIGWLFSLKEELQYIAEVLPCDINKYAPISLEIEKLISMVKGVRRSANRFLRRKPKEENKT